MAREGGAWVGGSICQPRSTLEMELHREEPGQSGNQDPARSGMSVRDEELPRPYCAHFAWKTGRAVLLDAGEPDERSLRALGLDSQLRSKPISRVDSSQTKVDRRELGYCSAKTFGRVAASTEALSPNCGALLLLHGLGGSTGRLGCG